MTVWDARALTPRAFCVGRGSGASKVTIDERGIVLERGAAWSAPLYYRRDEGVASANLTPLVRSDDSIDMNRIASILGEITAHGEHRTAYRGIDVVRPLETVVLQPNRQAATIRPGPRVLSIATTNVETLALELRQRLIAAVERETASARVALMLSGGMDSSALLAALFALRGSRAKDVIALTIDFDAPGSDRPHIRALEKYFGITVERIAPRDVSAAEAFVLDRAPSRHHGDMWILACARRAHALGADVLVTGTGGDRFLGGSMGSSIVDAIDDYDAVGLFDTFRAILPYRFSVRARARVAGRALVRHHAPRVVTHLRRRRRHHMPDWAGPLLRAEIQRASRETLPPHPVDARSRLYEAMTDPFESEYVGEARAQTDSAGPVPRVDPLYDEELVQFLLGIRQQVLFAGGTFRGLLRLALRGMLPESVRNRIDKARFEPALAEALPPDRFRSLLTFEASADAGLVDPQRLQAYLTPLIQDPAIGSNGERWMTYIPALLTESFLRS